AAAYRRGGDKIAMSRNQIAGRRLVCCGALTDALDAPARGRPCLTAPERAATRQPPGGAFPDGQMSALTGQHVLLVQIEAVIGLDLAALLRSQGAHVIGPARDVNAALSYIQSITIDCALLDIQLGAGEDVSPVADLLAQTEVPFIFVTAHDSH